MELRTTTAPTCFFGVLSLLSYGVDAYTQWRKMEARHKSSTVYLTLRATTILSFTIAFVVFTVCIPTNQKREQLWLYTVLLFSLVNEFIRTKRLYKDNWRAEVSFRQIQFTVVAAVVVVVVFQLVGFVLIWLEEQNGVACIMVAVGECIMHGFSTLVYSLILLECHHTVQGDRRKRILFRICGLTIISVLATVASGVLLIIHDATALLVGQLAASCSLDFFGMILQLCSKLDSTTYEFGPSQENQGGRSENSENIDLS